MPYALEPLVGGELGPQTVLDRSTHPPGVERPQYVLDLPTTADLLESFPIYLVSEQLAARLGSLSGFRLDDVDVVTGDQYGSAPHKAYR